MSDSRAWELGTWQWALQLLDIEFSQFSASQESFSQSLSPSRQNLETMNPRNPKYNTRASISRMGFGIDLNTVM